MGLILPKAKIEISAPYSDPIELRNKLLNIAQSMSSTFTILSLTKILKRNCKKRIYFHHQSEVLDRVKFILAKRFFTKQFKTTTKNWQFP